MLSVPSHQGRSEDTGAEEGKGFRMVAAVGQGQEQKWPRDSPCPGHVRQLGKGLGMEITTPTSLPQQTSPQEPGLTVGERVSQSHGGGQGMGTDICYPHRSRVPWILQWASREMWEDQRSREGESEPNPRLTSCLAPRGPGWLQRAMGLPATLGCSPGTLARRQSRGRGAGPLVCPAWPGGSSMPLENGTPHSRRKRGGSPGRSHVGLQDEF